MSMVGSFGAFRRAVHVIRCAGSDGSGVVRTALGRLRLAGLTRRGLQIPNTSGKASVPAARTVRTLSTHMGLALTEGTVLSALTEGTLITVANRSARKGHSEHSQTAL